MRGVKQMTAQVVAVLILALPGLANAPVGILKGSISDRNTGEPLPGATVLLVGTAIGAATDREGHYQIKEVPAGTYNLEIRLVGFEAVRLTDIVISPGRSTSVNTVLQQTVVEAEGVTVTAGYFVKDEVTPLGSVAFNAQEIRRSPGSANDVSRILMALPSTAAISDNANDLAVRGGSPMENAFFVDGIPIPNINHFPVQGSTGGPIGILNIDFVDNANFLTSGFSAAYGDRLSSVVDIKFREGNTDRVNGKAFVSFAGFGAMGEGPLPGESGSWMISANKSYLDLLVGAIGTGVAPQYGDIQGKATVNLAAGHRLTLMNIFGHSTIDFDKESSIDLGQRYYGVNTSTQNTAGASWRALWSKGFASTTSLSVSTTRFDNEFKKINSDALALRVDNSDLNASFRNLSYLMLGARERLEFGADLRFDHGQFDYFQLGDTTSRGTVDPDFTVARSMSSPKGALFATFITEIAERLTISAGARAEYYALSKSTVVAPRLSLSYRVNDRLTFSANSGIFYQQIPLVVLSSDRRFEGLDNTRAYHFGLGLEYMLRPDTRLSIEAYDKEYDRMPLNPDDPFRSVVDDALFNERFTTYTNLETVGKAYTRGVEIMIQKKMAQDLYGLVSASYFRSRYQDYAGAWRDRVYDNRFIFSVIGGYKPGQEWEFSARWTYAGGRPYTPFDETASQQANLGIIDQTRINAERYPAYHSLNIRIDRKFYFDSHLLDIYLSVWNAYNRANVAGYFWNSTENMIDTQNQWSLLPIVGVEYEF